MSTCLKVHTIKVRRKVKKKEKGGGIKVEIILEQREVAFLSPSNMPSTFEFFYCAPEKFKC